MGLGEPACDSLANLGGVVVLLAPNHNQNKGLREYAEVFPAARLCAASDADARLARIVSLPFDDVAGLGAEMPDHIERSMPPGLKTGEVWLSLKTPERTAWMVADGFCGPKGLREIIATRFSVRLSTPGQCRSSRCG